MKIRSDSRETTIKLGQKLGKTLNRGDIVALTGELGSGKTVFAKGIAKGLKVGDVRYVNSPSFVIVKEHKGRIPLYHFDIYRLEKPHSLESIGYDEYFYGDGVTVIEWADKIAGLLPRDRLEVEFSFAGEEGRIIKMRAFGTRFKSLKTHLSSFVARRSSFVKFLRATNDERRTTKRKYIKQ